MPIFALNDIQFWVQLFRYFVCVFVAYYIPGDIALSCLSIPMLFRFPLVIVVGMILLGFEGFITGFFGLRYASWFYIIICSCIWITRYKKNYSKIISISIDRISIILISVGALAQLSTIWFTGFMYQKSATYCCGDPNDNFFYGAISQEITHNFPPNHPGMNGIDFNNYHYWSNLVVGETARIFNLPVFQVHYQYSTILFSIITGLLLFGLCREIKASRSFSRWVLFFFYFGGDAIYWFIAITRSGSVFSMSSLEDGVGFFANYPRAMAFIVSIAAVTLLFHLKKRFSKRLLVITSLLFASLSIIKIYIGFFCYIGLLCLTGYEILKKRKSITLWVGILTLCFFIPLYMTANANAGSLYYSGFWRAENFITQPSLNLIRYEMARLIFEADHKWLKVLIIDIGFTILYFILIFGTKIIALFNNKKSYRKLPIEFHCFFIIPIILSVIAGFFFNQDIGGSNTFNFIVVSFLYLSFYAALFCSSVTEFKNRWITIYFIIIIVTLTIPRACYKTYNNIRNIITHKGFTISSDILDASLFIRTFTHKDAVILIDNHVFPWDKSGPVFSMLLDRPMFFSGEDFLRQFHASSAEITKRELTRNFIFSNSGILPVALALKNSTIDYILTKHGKQFGSTTSASMLEQWYNNSEVSIIKVHRELIPITIYSDSIEATNASEKRYQELVSPYLRNEYINQKN